MACTPAQLYALVNDVAAYPQWFDWCAGSRVIEQSETLMRAELTVTLVGLSVDFSTENELQPNAHIAMKLLKGPFSNFSGDWRFSPLGDTGCKVSLELNFDYAGPLGMAFGAAFGRLADQMVGDFVEVAKRVYA